MDQGADWTRCGVSFLAISSDEEHSRPPGRGEVTWDGQLEEVAEPARLNPFSSQNVLFSATPCIRLTWPAVQMWFPGPTCDQVAG